MLTVPLRARASAFLPTTFRWIRLPGAIGLLVLGLSVTAHAQKLSFRADLDGAQQVPPNASTASGTAWFMMDRAANTLTYRISIRGLTTGTETAAHIHGFAAPGLVAPVKHSLPLGTPKDGMWTYLESEEASIINGLAYASVHTSMGPGNGEIRGQILRDDSQAFMVAKIDSGQEVPPPGVASTATGTAYFSINTSTNTVGYRIEFSGLTSAETLAHIHGFAPPGTAAGIKVSLPLGNLKVGSWVYLEADEASYLAGLSYVNIHTASNGSGEIRGQILSGGTNPSTYCTAKLNSLGCTPVIGSTGMPSATAGSGFVVTGSMVRNNKSGLLFYGVSGGQASPFTGGTLCVAPSIKRTPGVNSGGAPAPANDCSGVYSFDMNAFAVGSLGGTPLAALTVAGTIVCCQFWGRDPGIPAPNNTTLTDALQYAIGP